MGRPRIDTEIALLVGRDLDEADRSDVERRVRTCPDARRRRDEMQRCLNVLHDCRDRPVATPERSVWPAVSARLPRTAGGGALEQFRPWVPAITVAGLLLALATVITSRPVPRSGGGAPLPALQDWSRVEADRFAVPAFAPEEWTVDDEKPPAVPGRAGFAPLEGETLAVPAPREDALRLEREIPFPPWRLVEPGPRDVRGERSPFAERWENDFRRETP